MRRPNFVRSLLILTWTLYFIDGAFAQDLGSIGTDQPLHVSGGISLNQVLYAARGITERREPFTYYASGNINFSLYGWDVPLSFSVSDQQTSFQQPFNQYSVHPAYKGITGHFGYTSLSYSPYTLNGHVFLGAGVDLMPDGKKWSVQGMFGRLIKSIEADSLTPDRQPAFKRMGFGLKTQYGDESNYVNLIIFHANDEVNSIAYVPDESITPMENLVISLGAAKQLYRFWLVKAEVASSALSRDTRLPEESDRHVQSRLPLLFTPRISSSFYTAVKSSIDYQKEGWTIGAGYERISPGYQTLGAYYFNNDLENITVNGSASIAQGKWNVSTSAGIQHDDLDHSKISSMHRTVGSLNLNFVPSQNVNLTASYSNFQTFTNIRSQFQEINQLTPYDNLDTLNFTQLSQNATLAGSFSMGANANKRQLINFNLVVQDAADRQGDEPQNSGTRFYTAGIAYTMQQLQRHISGAILFNASLNQSVLLNSNTYGPTATITRMFNEKIRATLSASYNNTYSSGIRVSSILSCRLNTSLTLKHHNFTLNLIATHRQIPYESARKSISEFTGMVGYVWRVGK